MLASVANLHARVPMDDQSPMASRSGVTNPLGKFTAEVKGFRIPEITHEGLERLAHEAGESVQEFVRDLVMVRVHGVDTLANLHADRLRVIAGKGKE